MSLHPSSTTQRPQTPNICLLVAVPCETCGQIVGNQRVNINLMRDTFRLISCDLASSAQMKNGFRMLTLCGADPNNIARAVDFVSHLVTKTDGGDGTVLKFYQQNIKNYVIANRPSFSGICLSIGRVDGVVKVVGDGHDVVMDVFYKLMEETFSFRFKSLVHLTVAAPISNCGKLLGVEGCYIQNLRREYRLACELAPKEEAKGPYRRMLLKSDSYHNIVQLVTSQLDLLTATVSGRRVLEFCQLDVFKYLKEQCPVYDHAAYVVCDEDHFIFLVGDDIRSVLDAFSDMISHASCLVVC